MERVANDIALTILAILSIGLLVYELAGTPSPETLSLIRTIDIGIALVFLAEFILRLFGAKNRKEFMSDNWWQLFASIPVTASGTQILRGLMLIRLFRLVRFTSVAIRINYFSESLSHFIKETRLAWIVTLLILSLFGGAVAFHLSEFPANPNVHTFFDSFWFASSAMTNTNMTEPVTIGGRIAGIFLMFSGVIIFGLFIASIASHLIHTKAERSWLRSKK